jgi:two-component system, NarL family, invasion response regulator UvrY
MIKVLIADDHPILRRGLTQIIADAGDMEVADEAADGSEALKKIRTEPFDVVLLDLSMPGLSGMDTLKQIKKEKPQLAVLVLSRYSEDEYAIPVLKAGASGYLTKTSVVEELVKAIRKVAGQGKYISPSLAEKLVEFGYDLEKPLHERLSDREREIMYLIAAGKTTSEIAAKLILSPSTVSTYRSRVLKKMKMKNDSDLIRYSLKNGLVE